MSEKQISISFSEQEINALRGLMDLGVKSGGLQVAEAAAVLNQKIMRAIQASQAVKPDLHAVEN
jgi:hypothetical protein